MIEETCPCGASIVKVPHERTGKLMPLDRSPTLDGEWQIVTHRGVSRCVHVKREQRHEGARLFKAHWATCPLAESFRKSPTKMQQVKG